MREVIIISGPTAAGKSAKALELARSMDAEIISCDSIQVYRRMDIGSAKPSKAERDEIRHHLIDVSDPSSQYSVDIYIRDAKAALNDILSRGKSAIVAGGSGFYLKAWFSAVTDEIPIPDSVRREVERLSGDREAMLQKLLEIDPLAEQAIDIKNPRRIRPALERAMASGLPLARLAKKFAELPCPMGDLPKRFLPVDLPDSEISERARVRISGMLQDGLVDETRALMDMGFEKNPSAAMAIGYRETLAAIKRNDFSSLAEEIHKNTMALVRKQRKFLKNALFKGVNREG